MLSYPGGYEWCWHQLSPWPCIGDCAHGRHQDLSNLSSACATSVSVSVLLSPLWLDTQMITLDWEIMFVFIESTEYFYRV